MRRRRGLATVTGALVAGALPFLLGQGTAAAATDDGQAQITFTVSGQPVTCRLFGFSNRLEDDGSAGSSTNGNVEPRCAAHLFVDVRYIDTSGVTRSSGSKTFTGTDVEHAVDGVGRSFRATHTARFLNCEDGQSLCQLSFTTTPK
ncbi:MAG: hypothetical protein M3R01_08445 [Actinomycetota bacterium]|nr:hypothetical protein [Actinomycetota bacterium]